MTPERVRELIEDENRTFDSRPSDLCRAVARESEKELATLRSSLSALELREKEVRDLLARQRDADDHYMSGECDICDDLDKTEDCPVMEKLTPKRYEIDAALGGGK